MVWKPKGQLNISTKILVNTKRCTLEEKMLWKERKDIHYGGSNTHWQREGVLHTGRKEGYT